MVRVRAKYRTSIDDHTNRDPNLRGRGVTRMAGEEFDFPADLLSSEPSLELASVPKAPDHPTPATKK